MLSSGRKPPGFSDEPFAVLEVRASRDEAGTPEVEIAPLGRFSPML